MAINETIQKYEVPYHAKRYIETELRMYKAYLASIQMIETELEEIYTTQSKLETPGGGELSNPPLSAVVKIDALEAEKTDKLKRIRKIQEGLALFPIGTTNRRIIEVKYFSGHEWSPEQIMGQIGVGRRNNYFERLTFIHRSFGIVFGICN